MEKIRFYLEKYKLYIIIFFICIFIFISLYFILVNKKENNVVKKEIILEKKEEPNIEVNTVRVDVKGYVEKEGVYELDSNSRVIDQTTPNMIQKLKTLFVINPLNIKEI